MHLFWINSCGFLVFVTFFQFVFTITSTLGIMSLFSVPINQMLYSIIFILMIINCHQSLLLYKNISNRKLRSRPLFNRSISNDNDRSPDSTRLDDLIEMDQTVCKAKNDDNLDIKEKLTNAIQIILVPSFCTLNTSVFAYLVIGLTSSIDAIRFYCFFLGKYIYRLYSFV